MWEELLTKIMHINLHVIIVLKIDTLRYVSPKVKCS
jgi:hypothetical protein